MKRIALITTIGILVLGLALTAVLAVQGPGKARGARAGQQGQPCPYGYDQPGGLQTGWWTSIQATTPEQKAFVADVAKLHEQIRTQNLEIARLRAANAPQAEIANAQARLDGLRNDMQNLMYKNRGIRQQMGGAGMRSGWQGRGAGAGRLGQPCPYGYDQTGAGLGGWWNYVQPTTPQQKAFVDSVKSLHARIRAEQIELGKLQTANAPQADIAKVQARLDGLRNEMQSLMYDNRELRQQMGGAGFGRGMRGQGAGGWGARRGR